MNAQKDWAALVGRILLSILFIISGFEKISGFEGTVGFIAGHGLPFPQVLDRLASDMNWTSQLGNAVLADRAAVMDAVQSERAAAQRYEPCDTTTFAPT